MFPTAKELTSQSVGIGRLGRKEDVREEPLEGVSGVARPVLDVVPDSRLKSPHEVLTRSSQLLWKRTRETNHTPIVTYL